MTIEIGAYYDNAAALETLGRVFREGDVDEAIGHAQRLYDHILATRDPKSLRLLPRLCELLTPIPSAVSGRLSLAPPRSSCSLVLERS
jgi:hypothetical protein